MRAVMLAAGVGRRLGNGDDSHPPKALLRLGGRTLLLRHVELLQALGVQELVIVVGYRADLIADEVQAIGAGQFIRTIDNPQFRRGSLVSLWAARRELAGGDDILFMDADVLYHPALIERLIASRHADCFLLDRDFEPGDEPVKLCLDNGDPVEFRKKIAAEYDVVGEWPGFLRLSPRIARRLADALQVYIDAGRFDEPYEEAIRDVLLSEPRGTFGVEDITGIPWIEIDFPADLIKAEREILPRIQHVETRALEWPSTVQSADGVRGGDPA